MPTGITVAAIVIIIVLGIIVVIQMIAITALLLVMKNLAQEVRERVDPLLTKVNSLLLTANEIAQTVQGKTEHIAEKTAATTDVISERVEKTTGLLQRIIAAPMIHGAAMSEGMARGARAWKMARRRRTAPCEEYPAPSAGDATQETVILSPTDFPPSAEEPKGI